MNQASEIVKTILTRCREVVGYLSYFVLPRPSNQRRAVIFAQGRTGSTLLESLLSSTGSLRKNGELLSTKRCEIWFPKQFISGLSKLFPGNFIFHVKIYQLTKYRKRPVDPTAFLTMLQERGWKIIYLRRENRLRQSISNLVAEHRGAYHKLSGSSEKIRINVDCEVFVEKVKELLMFEEHEREVLADLEYHEVVYEDDLEKPEMHQEVADRVFEYLGLEQGTIRTNLRKITTMSLRELIINYDEFESTVLQNGWGHLLDNRSK